MSIVFVFCNVFLKVAWEENLLCGKCDLKSKKFFNLFVLDDIFLELASNSRLTKNF